MGLTASQLWGLSSREYQALARQRERAQEFQISLVAALRADIHNTAGKSFKDTLKPADFMPGSNGASVIELRARELRKQGYAPAAALAIASSSQSQEQKLFLINSVFAARKKGKRKAG